MWEFRVANRKKYNCWGNLKLRVDKNLQKREEKPRLVRCMNQQLQSNVLPWSITREALTLAGHRNARNRLLDATTTITGWSFVRVSSSPLNGNIRGMYDSMRKPLAKVELSDYEVLLRWYCHRVRDTDANRRRYLANDYQKLYSRENVVTV